MSALLEPNQLQEPTRSTSARIREIEEREISALASHVEPSGDPRFCDIFCHGDDDNHCIEGTPRQLADKVYALGWQVDIAGNPLCPVCQNPPEQVNDEPVRVERAPYSMPSRIKG